MSGEIFGLSDTGTGAASSILIESVPGIYDTFPEDATLFPVVAVNSFTTVDDVITNADFESLDQTALPWFFFNLSTGQGESGFSENNNETPWQTETGLSATFTLEGSAGAPEPSTSVMLGLGLVGLSGILTHNKQRQSNQAIAAISAHSPTNQSPNRV